MGLSGFCDAQHSSRAFSHDVLSFRWVQIDSQWVSEASYMHPRGWRREGGHGGLRLAYVQRPDCLDCAKLAFSILGGSEVLRYLWWDCLVDSTIHKGVCFSKQHCWTKAELFMWKLKLRAGPSCHWLLQEGWQDRSHSAGSSALPSAFQKPGSPCRRSVFF